MQFVVEKRRKNGFTRIVCHFFSLPNVQFGANTISLSTLIEQKKRIHLYYMYTYSTLFQLFSVPFKSTFSRIHSNYALSSPLKIDLFRCLLHSLHLFLKPNKMKTHLILESHPIEYNIIVCSIAYTTNFAQIIPCIEQFSNSYNRII